MSIKLSKNVTQAILEALANQGETSPFFNVNGQLYAKYDAVKISHTPGWLVATYLWNGKDVCSQNVGNELVISATGYGTLPLELTTS